MYSTLHCHVPDQLLLEFFCMSTYTLDSIGFIRSTVKGREDAPRQGPEGAGVWVWVRRWSGDVIGEGATC